MISIILAAFTNSYPKRLALGNNRFRRLFLPYSSRKQKMFFLFCFNLQQPCPNWQLSISGAPPGDEQFPNNVPIFRGYNLKSCL